MNGQMLRQLCQRACLTPSTRTCVSWRSRTLAGCQLGLTADPNSAKLTPSFAGVVSQIRHKSHKSGGGSKSKDGRRASRPTGPAKPTDLSSIISPVNVKPCIDPDGINVGEELSGALNKGDLLTLLNGFYRRPEVKRLAAENGLDDKLFHQTYVSFRRFCIESKALPVDLHVALSDILREAGHVDDVFPYFLQHARVTFPHLDCIDDLRKVSDLRQPANWYPEARAIQRKIVFHSGPTNSGKTYHALERFMSAKSGVYCGPLRLLASEVYHKCNKAGTPCDLVTGEERRFVDEDNEPGAHVACTVEMTSVTTPYEVAVIDEIQMMRDPSRGWAWTRALLGVCAEEVHVCGEAAAIDMVQELALVTGDEVEVRQYKRLTSLSVMNHAVESVNGVKPGDCIVCFSKNDIYHVTRQLERKGHEVAVIYGTLPPGTKLAQASKFNDPFNTCKVMVATDAIGMGLNLSIQRVIFYSLVKPTVNEKGEKEIDAIPPSTALQIGGRAGRYGTQFENGQVTTFKGSDLSLLNKLLSTKIEPIQKAGLHPTAEQIELFAYHLPKATLSNLVDIFVTLSQVDSDRYFICNLEDFKFLADMIEHIPLQLRSRYVFCCAPIPKKQPFVCTMFLKFARQYSRGTPLTLDWLCRQLGWPFQNPKLIAELVHLECVFDVLDLYLWLSYRFPDLFPDTHHVRDMQNELDQIIQAGVFNLTRLLKNAETKVTYGVPDDEDDFEMKSRSKSAIKYQDDPDDAVAVAGPIRVKPNLRMPKKEPITEREFKGQGLAKQGLPFQMPQIKPNDNKAVQSESQDQDHPLHGLTLTEMFLEAKNRTGLSEPVSEGQPSQAASSEEVGSQELGTEELGTEEPGTEEFVPELGGAEVGPESQISAEMLMKKLLEEGVVSKEMLQKIQKQLEDESDKDK